MSKNIDKRKEKDSEEKKGIFFGVIGVLILIGTIIGSFFAYFSINAASGKDALSVQAASVQIVYEDGDNIAIDELIPSTQAIAGKALTRYLEDQRDGSMHSYQKCIDDNKRTVCGVYEFTVKNDSDSSINIKATVEPIPLKKEQDEEKEIEFKNLKFIMYDITSDNINGQQIYSGNIGYEKFGLFGASGDETKSIEGNGKETKYRLFIWLDEESEGNDVKQNSIFKGTVKIVVAGAKNGITGKIKD